MNENGFFDFTPISEEVKIKATEDRKRMNENEKLPVDNTSFRGFTGEDAFDFDENKKTLIADLDWLTNMSVEEFTFRKKYEEVQLVNDFIKECGRKAKFQIWSPTNLQDEDLTIKEITNLQPKMVLAKGDIDERLWTTLRIYCSSAEYNQAPGRFIRFILMDDVSGKILGISSIASDVISISDRDKYIGWTKDDKLKHKMLRHSAIGTTIVPTQPFGTNFLGGKLMAAMTTSGVVRDAWETNLEKSEAITCKLVGMTTTSLYGTSKKNFSMYNGLKWWKPVGLSKGKVPVKPYEKSYYNWHTWLKENKDTKKQYIKAMTQKEGVAGPVTGAKMRVLNMIFNACKIKQSEYCHGFERGVYYSCFYENTKEFLCRKITEDELVMKPLFKNDVSAILE